MNPRYERRSDAAEVAARLAEQIASLAPEVIGSEPASKEKDRWRWRRRGSLVVWVSGTSRGRFKDFESGDGGDALALVAYIRGLSMREAWEWGLGRLGEDAVVPQRAAPPSPSASPKAAAADDSSTLDLAKRLWREGQPAAGSLVEAYLASRRVGLPDAGAVLRFHPSCWRNTAYGPHGPAMLALMTDLETGEPRGVHVTYLRADGGGKAAGERVKVMLGRTGVVRLVPDDEVVSSLGIAEGIETALSVMTIGWRPCWAATSAGGIARLPVPCGIECLTVFTDADDAGAGARAAQACVDRWTEAGRMVRVITAPSGVDFNDVLTTRAA